MDYLVALFVGNRRNGGAPEMLDLLVEELFWKYPDMRCRVMKLMMVAIC